MPRIKKVTYSKPVTLIRWDDDTITKAFCDEVDNYDELTGFLMCIIKKMVPAKEMRKLFSKYVYGNDPKYIKRIVPKKKENLIHIQGWTHNPCININGTDIPTVTLELDPTAYATRTTTTNDIEEFTKSLDELIKLLSGEE